MKIGVITGSPKPKDSASRRLAQYAMDKLCKENEIYEFCIPRNKAVTKEELFPFTECDALLFFFPVYIDSIPGHMLPFLQLLECCMKEQSAQNIMVYAFSICGFRRGQCGKYSMDMLRIWTKKCGLTWGQAGGCGGGEGLANTPSIQVGHWPYKKCGLALDSIINNLLAKKSDKDVYAEPDFTNFLFFLSAYQLWFSKRKGSKIGMPKLFFQTSIRKIK